MKIRTNRIAPAVLSAALAFGVAACDGNAQDDLDAIEENVEEGVEDVGEAADTAEDEMDEELIDESEEGDDITDDDQANDADG